MGTLRGIALDGGGTLDVLRAAAAEWAVRGGAAIAWEVAPAPGSAPAELAEGCDVLALEPSHLGAAAVSGALAPLEELLGSERLAALAADAAGPAHAAYRYDDRQWALAFVAGCQVAAARADLLGGFGAAPPASWRQVLELARARPGRVGWPLGGGEALCSLLALCANAGRPVAAGATLFADGESGEAALGFLAELSPLLHPRSLEATSPELLELMAETGEIAYAPLVFGDPRYARPGGPGSPLAFGDVPSAGHGPAGSVLGGAGLAVAARSGATEAAAAFVAWLAGPEGQAAAVVAAGAQPASRRCREDPALDAASGGFFSATGATLAASAAAPRDPWWPEFACDASGLLAEFLTGGGWARLAAAELERLHRRHRGASAPGPA